MSAPNGFRRVLVASRGPAARRVARAVHEAGLEVVVLVDETDGDATWPDLADYAAYAPHEEGRPWPGIGAVVSAAFDSGCDLVHPGWGRAASSVGMAQDLAMGGIATAGPTLAQLDLAGDRARLLSFARELGIGVVPGTDPITELAEAEAWLSHAGFPVLVKLVDSTLGLPMMRAEDRKAALAAVTRLLELGPVRLERRVEGAREIEVPFVGQGNGEVLLLGEVDTTVNLHGTRLVGECPAAGLSEVEREELHQMTLVLAANLGWRGLGSARFLLPPDGRPYLLQLKAGLQPWHAAVEEAFGVDLVDAQLRLAADESLGWGQGRLEPERQAISLRVLALDDPRGAGRIRTLRLPEGVRVDLGPEEGDAISPGDEILVLTVRGATRQATLVKAKAALDALKVEGVVHTGEGLRALFDQVDFFRGAFDRDESALVLDAWAAGAG